MRLSDGTFLEVRLPFTIEFDVTRYVIGSLNYSHFRIYNLNTNHRELIRRDYANFSTLNNVRELYFYAGYGEELSLVYTGIIYQAWSFREGTNYITTVQCLDGYLANTLGTIPSNYTPPGGTTYLSVYEYLMGKGYTAVNNPLLPYTAFGAIGPSVYQNAAGSDFTLNRSISPSGNTISFIKQLIPNAFFIDNGISFILGNNEGRTNGGSIKVITSQDGLLSTPYLENTIISFDMLFEPSLAPAQIFRLSSAYLPAGLNAEYKINLVNHKGMISEAVCGDLVTHVEAFYALGDLIPVTDK